MRNTTDDRNKKRLAALLCALLFGGLAGAIALVLLLSWLGAGIGGAAGLILLLYALVYLAIAVGVGLALRQRWREIEGGEEDEARKY